MISASSSRSWRLVTWMASPRPAPRPPVRPPRPGRFPAAGAVWGRRSSSLAGVRPLSCRQWQEGSEGGLGEGGGGVAGAIAAQERDSGWRVQLTEQPDGAGNPAFQLAGELVEASATLASTRSLRVRDSAPRILVGSLAGVRAARWWPSVPSTSASSRASAGSDLAPLARYRLGKLLTCRGVTITTRRSASPMASTSGPSERSIATPATPREPRRLLSPVKPLPVLGPGSGHGSGRPGRPPRPHGSWSPSRHRRSAAWEAGSLGCSFRPGSGHRRCRGAGPVAHCVALKAAYP
jgi:hypothetical protein